MGRCKIGVLGLVLTCCAGVDAGDWPQFLGPLRDGSSAETGLIASWPKEGPKLAWRKAIGEGYSGPVIAGEALIVFHRIGDEEVIESWRASDGKFQWKSSYPCSYQDGFGKGNGPRATPAIVGKRVVTLGAGGDLTCLDLDTGTKQWSKNLTKEYRVPESFFGVGTSPVVDDDLILINVGAKGAGIVAFRLDNGKEVWKSTSDGASYSSPVVRTLDGVKHAIFLTRDGPVILDPRTGEVRHKQRWRARNDASVNAATPLVIGHSVFFSTSYETGALLLQLQKAGADELWNSDELMSNHYNTCIANEGYLYGFDGRQEAVPSFRCVDLKGKKVNWEQKRFGCGSIILAENRLIIMTERGDLVLVAANPEKYTELSRARVLDAGPVRAQIALANGRLYGRDQKQLVCLDMRK